MHQKQIFKLTVSVIGSNQVENPRPSETETKQVVDEPKLMWLVSNSTHRWTPEITSVPAFSAPEVKK